MGTCKKWIKGLVSIGAMCVSFSVLGQNADIGSQIEYWKQWVSAQKPHFNCPIETVSVGGRPDRPFEVDGKRQCTFVSIIGLQKQAGQWSATFAVRNDSAQEQEVLLPMPKDGWVQSVKVGGVGQTVLVSRAEDGTSRAAVLIGPKQMVNVDLILDVGNAGFKQLLLPNEASLVQVKTEQDQKVLTSTNGASGQKVVSLEESKEVETKTVVDSGKDGATQVTLHRYLQDGQMIEVRTLVRIVNRGAAKKIQLEGVTLEREQLVGLTFEQLSGSGLGPISNVRVVDGKIELSVPSGISYAGWIGILKSDVNVFKATPKASVGVQLDPKEYWFVDSDPLLRRMEIVGLAAIDPTNLPKLSVPVDAVYESGLGQGIEVAFSERSEISVEKKTVNHRSQVWVDFDGKGATYKQILETEKNEPGRWQSSGWQLQQARINGEAQLLLESDDGGGTVVGYPKGTVHGELIATSALGWINGLVLPASLVNEQQLDDGTWTVQLPAGWRALAVSGSASASNVWLSQFDLWDWFILILTLWGIKSVLGMRFVPLIGIGMLVGKLHLGAPFAMFLPIVLIAGVLKHLPQGWFKKIAFVCFGVLGVLLLVQLGSYSIERIQKTIHSSLEDGASKGAVAFGSMASMERARNVEMMGGQRKDLMEKHSDGVAQEALSMRAPAMAPAPVPAMSASSTNSVSDEAKGGSTFTAAQAGIGEPSWKWYQVDIHQTNPVSSTESITLWLLPSWLHKLLTVLALVCFWVVTIGLVMHVQRFWSGDGDNTLGGKNV